MKRNEAQIGKTYLAIVADKVVGVRLDAENPLGGWDATNMVSGKKIRIKSVKRLRGPAENTTPAADPDLVPLTQLDKEKKASGKPKGKAAGAGPKVAKEPKAPKADKGMSCLEAAAAVLKASAEPMQCKAMIDAMHTQKLWTSDAPTPSATLYSAILREIQKKGSASRFKKTERGHFALNA